MWLNVSDGVTSRGANHSRYNLRNIIATTNATRLMLEEKLWTEEEISVITPYREQAARYRQFFRRQKSCGIQSIHGRLSSRTTERLYDFIIVLSSARHNGSWGFLQGWSETERRSVKVVRESLHLRLRHGGF